MLKFELEKFSGPLDLLLQLIEQEELDISQVALAKVTNQYLSYLDSVINIEPGELADFLVVATKLLIIKSKIILPQLADEEDDSAEQLEFQLKLYKDYLEASKVLENILAKNRICFSRERIISNLQPTFSPPPETQLDGWRLIFEEILKRIDYVTSLPQKVMEKVVSLKDMVGNIRQALIKAEKFSFHKIISQAKSKTEMVVCFMALLELIKNGEVAVNQKGIFDEIMVEKAI
ncbi:MAG: segregation/condensation protein A [Patescibacteria group bacterium]